MNELQITLICLLGVLGVAFIVLLLFKFTDRPLIRIKQSKNKINKIVDILTEYDDMHMQWEAIWPLYYKNSQIQYDKIGDALQLIINSDGGEYVHIQDRAVQLLKNKVADVVVYGDNEISHAISCFREEVNTCGHQKLKQSGNDLIETVKKYCKNNRKNSRYDIVIQWIFNAIEIVGFIFAIVTL